MSVMTIIVITSHELYKTVVFKEVSPLDLTAATLIEGWSVSCFTHEEIKTQKTK